MGFISIFSKILDINQDRLIIVDCDGCGGRYVVHKKFFDNTKTHYCSRQCELIDGHHKNLRLSEPFTETSPHIVLCPQGHCLIEMTQTELQRKNCYYSFGYECDECDATETSSNSYHCITCEYDLCPVCVNKCRQI
jgi:hypothetical protein